MQAASFAEIGQRGLGLVELLSVLAIVGILLGLVAPSYARFQQHAGLRGATDAIYSDLMLARSIAIKRSTKVYVGFLPGTNWCYSLTTDPSCSCDVECATPDAVIKTTRSDGFPGISIAASNGAGVAFAGSQCGSVECTRFEGVRGTAAGANGSVALSAPDGSRAKVIVSNLGRVRSCKLAGDYFSALEAC